MALLSILWYLPMNRISVTQQRQQFRYLQCILFWSVRKTFSTLFVQQWTSWPGLGRLDSHFIRLHCWKNCLLVTELHRIWLVVRLRRQASSTIAQDNYIVSFNVWLINTSYPSIHEASKYCSSLSGQWWIKNRWLFAIGLEEILSTVKVQGEHG